MPSGFWGVGVSGNNDLAKTLPKGLDIDLGGKGLVPWAAHPLWFRGLGFRGVGAWGFRDLRVQGFRGLGFRGLEKLPSHQT